MIKVSQQLAVLAINARKMQAGISDQKLSIQYVNFWVKYILIVLITRIFSCKANTGLEMNRKLA